MARIMSRLQMPALLLRKDEVRANAVSEEFRCMHSVEGLVRDANTHLPPPFLPWQASV